MVNIKNAVAECVGSFMLVFLAIGILSQDHKGHLEESLGMGFVFVALYYSVCKASGCHLNPAVSLGCLLKGKLDVMDFIFYLIFQIVGACLGALALFGFYEMVYNLDKTNFRFDGANMILDYYQKGYTARGVFATFLIEMILTCILVFVILSVENSSDFREYNGVIIGCAYTFVTFAAFYVDFGCLNPARALATCLSQVTYFEKTESFELVWIWIVAPLVGGILGYVLTLFIGGDDKGSAPNRSRSETNNPMNSEERAMV